MKTVPKEYEELEKYRAQGWVIQWRCPLTGWHDILTQDFEWVLRPYEYRVKHAPGYLFSNGIKWGLIPEGAKPPRGFAFNDHELQFVTVRRLSDGADYYVEWDGDQIKRLVRKRRATLFDVIRTYVRSRFKTSFRVGEEYYDDRDVINISMGDTMFDKEADAIFAR